MLIEALGGAALVVPNMGAGVKTRLGGLHEIGKLIVYQAATSFA